MIQKKICMLGSFSVGKTEPGRPHPMRHVLTNVVGARDQVEVHVRELALLPGDRLLLCSDGLHEPMTVDLIAPVLGAKPTSRLRPRDWCAKPSSVARADNVTALVVDVGALK